VSALWDGRPQEVAPTNVCETNHYRNFNDRKGAPADQESILSGMKRLLVQWVQLLPPLKIANAGLDPSVSYGMTIEFADELLGRHTSIEIVWTFE